MGYTLNLSAQADRPAAPERTSAVDAGIPAAPSFDSQNSDAASMLRRQQNSISPVKPSLPAALESNAFLVPPAPGTDLEEVPANIAGKAADISAATDGKQSPANAPRMQGADALAAPSAIVGEEKPIPPAPELRPDDSEWTIVIKPNQPKGTETPKTYADIYSSIPYRRAEYLANPSYRHDTTMEILFGQLRPTVINRTDNPVRVVNPRPAFTKPYPISKGELYSYWPLLQYGSALPLLSPIP
jgi:hypothetical protein